MVSLNTFSIQISPVFKCPIPGLDYVVFVKGSGPHDIQYHYQQDRPPNEVIVSRKCAEAVLRGAQRAVLMLKKGIKLQFRLVLNSPVVTVNGLRELHGQGFGKGVHNQNIRVQAAFTRLILCIQFYMILICLFHLFLTRLCLFR
ncbi:hypothetical protein HanRHA438_Chr12g0574891 [Helianthus annuus]|uniref:Uncharacterized protein n=1 Tax=Helianthus annuus TaxID=4232 RepID=A0A9K3J5S9_HELAN|nr:hypothetical protein HanXRQr2_Chr12g0563491 [Helianthus annuus]KAF5809338.1 hypothetical protein HanXRQr2_Chr04g0155961 [Helianthus annuus]KAJ0495412.1 hypothetical protein HanIR_Chr12g0608481 [Helianthus annuus]KAJ0506953.1 hypothetical protein HanHA89_Chr12g0487841 [Helianthus annuus]KAJ0676585.1 hypothetical protein HanLR1_Chr12g0464401 [Helianthus annuus]